MSSASYSNLNIIPNWYLLHHPSLKLHPTSKQYTANPFVHPKHHTESAYQCRKMRLVSLSNLIQREHVIKIVYYTSRLLADASHRLGRHRWYMFRFRLITLCLCPLFFHWGTRSRLFWCLEGFRRRSNGLLFHDRGNVVTNIACSIDFTEFGVEVFCIAK